MATTEKRIINISPDDLSGKRVYFVGIGGISMSSLAFMSHDAGMIVSGYDRTRTEMTERLEAAGIAVYYEYAPTNAEGCELAVYTAAMSESDPEMVRLRELGIPMLTRAEYMGQLMRIYAKRIGVSGMHGKSTATSMLSHIYLEAGLDPTLLIGAELSVIGGAFRVGSKDSMVFEACEYTDSFLSFFPTTAVVLNIEMDHVDYFHSLEQIRESFAAYIAKAEIAVLNGDDENVRMVQKTYGGRAVTFGLGEGCDYRAVNIVGAKPEFDVICGGSTVAHVALSVPGRHNVYNALASFAAAHVNGVPVDGIVRGLNAFVGAKRRFELRRVIGGSEIYDDYAHHPTEIRAVLSSAKPYAKERGGRLRIVYQPHTYSRTAELFADFADAFADADEVVFADIYAAREVNEWGVHSSQLADAVKERGVDSRYIEGFEPIADYVRATLGDGDVVIVMGAGDIIKVTGLI